MEPEDIERAEKLNEVFESKTLETAKRRYHRGGYYSEGPLFCIFCTTLIPEPVMIKGENGKRYVTFSFCSQKCHDDWIISLHIPGPHYEWKDQDGNLLGFFIPKRGFIRLDDHTEVPP